MIERYSRPEMAAVWSEQHRLELWQRIEVLAAEAWAAEGTMPQEAAVAIAAAPPVDLKAWREREAEIHHDVGAFVDVLADSVGQHGRWVHYGLTSSDVLDTALAVQLGEASQLIGKGIAGLFETLRGRAREHRNTAVVGRTHGMWAEPTTFGHKLAGFAFELARAHRRVAVAAEEVAYGKLSGPVGTGAGIPQRVEQSVMAALGLGAEPAPTQAVARDRHAAFLSTLAGVGASLERLATEVRNLQRSEVAEVAEPFAGDQKGSSAMPHKRNPILSENVTGLARLLRGYALGGLEDVALWHERDISHSSVERVVLPDACLVLDFALARMNHVAAGLVVDTERMSGNLSAAGDTVFSHTALLALVRAGTSREEAYRAVQEASAKAAGSDERLGELLAGKVDESVFSLEPFIEAAAKTVDLLDEVELRQPSS